MSTKDSKPTSGSSKDASGKPTTDQEDSESTKAPEAVKSSSQKRSFQTVPTINRMDEKLRKEIEDMVKGTPWKDYKCVAIVGLGDDMNPRITVSRCRWPEFALMVFGLQEYFRQDWNGEIGEGWEDDE